MTTSPVVVGIDGGGTRTRALVLDADGREMGVLDGPAGLVDPTRPAAGIPALEALIREAVGNEGPLAALWVGLAGVGRESVRRSVEAALSVTGIAGVVGVGTDLEAALQDAHGGDPGILLVAGTGSAAVRRSPDGALVRSGGWGRLLGDEGSGYAIGLEGLRALTRAFDGRGARTELTPVLLEAAGVAEVGDLVAWVAGATKSEIAALAPLVLELASSRSDPVAAGIRDRAVSDLAELVSAVCGAPALEGGAGESDGAVALSGGLICPGGPLRSAVEAAMEDLGLTVVRREVRPERGAAALALSLLLSI